MGLVNLAAFADLTAFPNSNDSEFASRSSAQADEVEPG